MDKETEHDAALTCHGEGLYSGAREVWLEA